jgi:hypothetical protein
MLGTLGRGGSGIYAMDVTEVTDGKANPKFMWYYETLEGVDKDPEMVRVFRQTSGQTDPAMFSENKRNTSYWNHVIGIGAAPDSYPYEQLGYNSPKPGFGVNGSNLNIIAVPGGMQNGRVNAGDNGKMGAALYLIDPANPDSPRVFNNASYNSVSGPTRTWG